MAYKTATDAALVTSGTLDPARLTANVALMRHVDRFAYPLRRLAKGLVNYTTRSIHLVILGDSITAGYNATAGPSPDSTLYQGSYSYKLSQALRSLGFGDAGPGFLSVAYHTVAVGSTAPWTHGAGWNYTDNHVSGDPAQCMVGTNLSSAQGRNADGASSVKVPLPPFANPANAPDSSAVTTGVAAGAGLNDGTYYYAFTVVNGPAAAGMESALSAAIGPVVASNGAANNRVTLSNMPVYQNGPSVPTVAATTAQGAAFRKIYRSTSSTGPWQLVTTQLFVASTTYTDTTASISTAYVPFTLKVDIVHSRIENTQVTYPGTTQCNITYPSAGTVTQAGPASVNCTSGSATPIYGVLATPQFRYQPATAEWTAGYCTISFQSNDTNYAAIEGVRVWWSSTGIMVHSLGHTGIGVQNYAANTLGRQASTYGAALCDPATSAPEALVIELGVNDFFATPASGRAAADVVTSSLRPIGQQGGLVNTDIVIIGVSQPATIAQGGSGNASTYATLWPSVIDGMRFLCESNWWTFVSIYDLWRGDWNYANTAGYQDTSVHPTGQGHTQMAAFLSGLFPATSPGAGPLGLNFNQVSSLTTTGNVTAGQILQSDGSGGLAFGGSGAATGVANTFTAAQTFQISDAGTTSTVQPAILQHASSGTPAANFGAGMKLQLHSSNNTMRDAAQIVAAWSVATDGSQDSYIAFYTTAAGTLAERMRIDKNGSLALRSPSPSALAYAYFPWKSGDTLTTMYVGDTSSNRTAVSANSGTGTALQATSGASTVVQIKALDAGTTGVTSTLQLWHATTATAAAGFGSNLETDLDTNGASGRPASKIITSWADATDASRKSRLGFSVFDTAERPALRLEADGANPMIGVLGAAAAARQTGGAATASGTYGATEQGMIQKAYDALRTFGFLT